MYSKMEKFPTRILIVDDEEIIRDSLRQLLESCGYQVETSSNGDEALKKLSESYFNLIMVDIMMPGMSGLEFIRRVRDIFPGQITKTAPKTTEYPIRPVQVGDTAKPHKDIIIISGYANLERYLKKNAEMVEKQLEVCVKTP